MTAQWHIENKFDDNTMAREHKLDDKVDAHVLDDNNGTQTWNHDDDDDGDDDADDP